MIGDIRKNVEDKMHKSLNVYKDNLKKIRTGRAHSGILDHILVDYYGSMLPINQVANVTVSDARTIVVQPWEAKMAQMIEKAIRESDLGLNPAPSGVNIIVPMPLLTEERRKELIKVVKSEAEESKVVIRKIRQDANADLKNLLKEKLITEDDDKRTRDEIQKITDKYIVEIDKATHEKETELLKV